MWYVWIRLAFTKKPGKVILFKNCQTSRVYSAFKVLRRKDTYELHTRAWKRSKLGDFLPQSGSGQQKRILVSINIVNLDLSSCFPTRIKYDHRALKITRTGKSHAPKFSSLEKASYCQFIREIVTKSYI